MKTIHITSYTRLAFLFAALTTTITVPAATNCLPPPAGMIAWWAGDGDARDFVATNDGVLKNGAAFTNGLVGQAFLLDGINDYVEVADSPSSTLTTAFTVEGWVMPGIAKDGDIVCQYDTYSQQASWSLTQRANGTLDFGVYSGSASAPIRYVRTPTGAMSVGRFIHVAATVDLGTQSIKLYVDGTQKITEIVAPFTNAIAMFFSSISPIRIGASREIGGSIIGNFAGIIDEVSLYNRVLSPDEIAAIYTAGSAGKCRQQPAVALLPFAPEVTNTTCIPLSFRLTVQAKSGSYPIHGVEYYDGATLIGQSTNWARAWRAASASLPHGLHSITAQAVDTHGLRATSQVASVVLKWPDLHTMHANLTTSRDVVCCMGALPGTNYLIEAAPEMGEHPTWLPYLTNRPAGDILLFTNPPAFPERYFRARPGP